MTDLIDKYRAHMPPLTKLMGVELTEISPDRVRAEMVARDELGNGGGILHGGAYMAFADYLGAVGTELNLPRGKMTTTLESKTNFFAPAVVGTLVKGESVPLHKGRRTMVWQTRLTNVDGRLLCMVTQTQMVMDREPKRP